MPRSRLVLDGHWEFIPDPQQRFDPDTLDQADAPRRIRVPGPWQAQFQDLRDYTGVAWYRLRFDVPRGMAKPPMPEPTYILHFGAVDYFSAVWLSGRYLGAFEGGYLPFEMRVDDALNLTGANELIVRVLDPGTAADVQGETEFAFSEIPHGKQSWYGPLGGIWQSVYLEARHSTHLTRLHITPDVPNERARVELELSRPAPEPLCLRLTLTDPQHGSRQFSFRLDEGSKEFDRTLDIPSPRLWDTREPNLYHLEATLQKDEPGSHTGVPVLDALGSNFGMRSISASADGHLMLNGRKLYLRGALDQDYYPDLIYTPFSDAELERQFAQAKHMGLNCLRTHIKITDPRYYDAADRAGLLIWTELPNWENLTPAVKQRARDTLAGMIDRDWNHPSIIIWTLVNESWGVELGVNAEHRQWLSETYDYVKQLDPHRLVVGNSACFSNFHVVTDIQDFHNYYAIPDHYQKWRDWVENFSTRPAWVYAHEYQDFKTWRAFLRDPWKPRELTPAAEVRRTGTEPMVISEFGNWGLPDVDKLRACYGDADPWWFETGMEMGEGAVYPHGVLDRYKRWHLDKVFPTFPDLARASQEMQFVALKYEIEQIRLHPSIVGYVITEFTDVHWECNGLLDMCRNPKVYYDQLEMINGADVLVPRWKRISFWEGEQCTIGLTLSHFSNCDLHGGWVDWSLFRAKPLFGGRNEETVSKEPGLADIAGSFKGLEPLAAQNTEIGTISFQVPHVTDGQRARLVFRLYDAQGNLVTTNFQDLYLFPREQDLARELKVAAPPSLAAGLESLGYAITDLNSADVVVVDQMTDELRLYVQRGGLVLWLADSAEARQTHLGEIDIVPREGRRWQGDWASNFNWLRHDALFKNIPTDGKVDFAFADLTPEHIILGFRPRDFATEVHAGLFVGWLHHPVALIGERRLGDGRVLISTFRLREHLTTHPVAQIMVRDMIAHLARRSRSYTVRAPLRAQAA